MSDVVPTALPEQLVRTRRFTLGLPDQFTITQDGSVVLFLRSRGGNDPVNCLWVLDVDSGAERVLADPAELLATDAGNGIGTYATDLAGGLAAFTLGGELWAVDVAGGSARRLPTAGRVLDPRPDPTGQRVAYVADGALRVINADGTTDHTIATPDGPDVAFGNGELLGVDMPGLVRGHWWSPDGARLLVVRVDASEVELWHIADTVNPRNPPRKIRYAAVGKKNAEVTLWIVNLDGSSTEARWDRAAFEYVLGGGWDSHGPHALVQSRNQRRVQFLGIDVASGDTAVLAEQHDDCWVQWVPGLPARTESGAVVTHLDHRGARHLTVDGSVVTDPGLQLRAVLDVDRDDVLFTASEDPTETHLWRYRHRSGVQRLSVEPGVHSGTQCGGTLVHVARLAGQPGVRVTVSREGTPPVSVGSLVEPPVLDVHATHLVLGPRALRAVLYLPSWHRETQAPLPLLVDPYGGAGLQKVTAELAWHSLVSQWFAELGFAVLVADGSGTPGRGPDWEREVHGDMFGPVIDDQVAAVQEAARLNPFLDLGRVGIRGWSFGGSLAALAVMRRPDVFHVAVAGAGVADPRLYNAHWRERFLGHPDEFPERYDAGSLLLAAAELTRPLLLIHGLADDNVYPANTLRLSSALLAAGRPHEVLLLPGVGHQAMSVGITENLLLRQAQFLQQHLGVHPQPASPERDPTSRMVGP